jgi:hypothetical protein
MVLHHVIISILYTLILCLQVGDLIGHRINLLSQLAVQGFLAALKVRFLLGYFLNARFNLDAKPVSLLFFRGEKGLELLKRNVFLVRLPLKAHYLVLKRLYSQGDSL